jgi:tetrahydromethanopterin S-methyltransferase subunit B
VNREKNAPLLTPDQALDKLMNSYTNKHNSSDVGVNVMTIIFVFIVGALIGGLVAYGIVRK